MNDYSKYKVEDFAKDPSFIAWVLNRSKQDHIFWEAWSKKHPQKEWYVQEAKKLVQSFNFKEEPFSEAQVDKLWEKIDLGIAEEPHSRRIPLRRWTLYAAAAIALLGISFYFLFQSPDQIFQTANGEQLSQTLPDGSKVYLNAASKVNFPKEWNSERTLEMSGEAFFEVKKGERFTVNTAFGKVEVLGTAFNIFARNDKFYVTCYSGEVRVTGKKGRPAVLTKGQSAKFNRGQLRVFEDTTQISPEWQSGSFSYNSVPLMEVIQELERQFDVEVDVSRIATNRYYYGFFTNNNLDSALYSITFPMDLKAEKVGQQIVITENTPE